ncbi:MAG: CIA30 family protein [Pseudomonadota bacterium]
MAETQSCTTLLEHTDDQTENSWSTVNDGVMGGRSEGGSVLEDGVLTFAGITNTNGGGFSSIRLNVPRGAMTGANHLKVHMKADARTYSMTLRTNAKILWTPDRVSRSNYWRARSRVGGRRSVGRCVESLDMGALCAGRGVRSE